MKVLLLGSGFAPARYFFDMVCELDSAAPSADLPDGLRVIAYDAAWSKAALTAHNEAFAEHWGFQLTRPEPPQLG